jgi:NlpC/P60 family putative phage cell wall peptidase
MISRHAILAEAREWIGTPYQHQASAKGAGCDCLGLVRGVWRAVCGEEPEPVPPYTPDWAERCGSETLLAAALRHLVKTPLKRAAPGDVLLFRMDARAPIKHCAILEAPIGGRRSAVEAAGRQPWFNPEPAIADCPLPTAAHIIHAYWGRAVVRSRLAPWWRARLAAAFQFPDVQAWPS